MLLSISDGAWTAIAAIVVALVAAAASVTSAVIGLFQRRDVKSARTELSDIATTNTADHGTVALALSRLADKVEENHRRSGERFERLGERMGEIAYRQEQTNARIDGTNERIDDVIKSQRDHLQHHIDAHP